MKIFMKLQKKIFFAILWKSCLCPQSITNGQGQIKSPLFVEKKLFDFLIL